MLRILFGICKADYFQLWFLCKSDLHFYCRKKRLSELITFKPNENDSITLLIRLRPAGSKGTVVNRPFPCLYGGSQLELSLQSLYTYLSVY